VSDPVDWRRFSERLSTVSVPEQFDPLFLRAQEYVARYFHHRVHRPDLGTIAIAGERYVLMRAASMSVEFVDLVTSLYQDRGPAEARSVANNLLFDLAHSIGKADAKSFHLKMNVVDPIEKLSAGPVHFAFSGWAFVHIFPESRPSPDDDYYLIFDHPFSFESHAWQSKGRTSDRPVCIMNAGYSSGWCEESFGVPLVSAEVECTAAGGRHCRFIMAPPSRIEEHLLRYARDAADSTGAHSHAVRSASVAVPEFFQRRRMEDELRKANELLDQRVRERTAELSEAYDRLQRETVERRSAEGQLRLLGSAIENATEGIFILAPGAGEPRISFVNRGLRRLTGRSEHELVGSGLEALGVVGDDAAVLDGLRRSLAEGRAFQAEASAERADGATYALELHVMPGGEGATLHWIGIVRDVSERKTQLAALRRQALHDALTDLPNRVLLYDRLEQEILKAERNRGTLGLLFMDLDGFKEINDTFGHHCGDQLLCQVGPRLRAALRASDTVARLGGDEFAILLPDLAGTADAERVARTVLAAIAQPFQVEGQVLSVAASIGIVLCPEHGGDASTLMRRADVAMYVAKYGERGFEVYSAEADANSPARLTLLGELRRDECREQLVLHFQPEIALRDGRARRAEALVRWQHPQRGLLLPREFIPLAERANLVQRVTEWVLGGALEACRRWHAAGCAIGIAVNLSPRSLRAPRFPDVVADLLNEHGVAAEWLTLEITEGSLLAEPTQALSILERLREIGVRLSIDDFGTGYSSLAHLRHLPVTEIKIDRTFVEDMARNQRDAAIVRSLVDLGHDLGRDVVAEGIEDDATLKELVACGCDLGQGHAICRPLPEDALASWLHEHA
jgi:diguanylate cyclase (GGDEF)-like protein/PAS domain S-box-containing protein